jgi:hypothetical protein
MPSQRLIHRVGNLHASPTWMAMVAEQQDELDRRVIAAEEFADLSAEDQDLIRRGELEVSAGLSPRFQDPSTWGDWTAIEQAMDSGDNEALDRALEMVGPGDGNGMVGPDVDDGGELSAEDEAELAMYADDTGDDLVDEAKGLGPDDDGWVG